MGWFGKLTFGSLGMLFGGPIGAIAGAALGHVLVDKKIDFAAQAGRAGHEIPEPQFGYAEKTQAAFFISLFSILGKLSKIDGVVSKEEIAVVQDFINGLPIDETEKQFARQVFNEAKNSPTRSMILPSSCTAWYKTSLPCWSPILIFYSESSRPTALFIRQKKPL